MTRREPLPGGLALEPRANITIATRTLDLRAV